MQQGGLVRLSVITDEISADMPTALRVAESLDIDAVEVRVVDDRNIVEHPADAWRRLAHDLAAGGVSCPAPGSPVLKGTPGPPGPPWGGADPARVGPAGAAC